MNEEKKTLETIKDIKAQEVWLESMKSFITNHAEIYANYPDKCIRYADACVDGFIEKFYD